MCTFVISYVSVLPFSHVIYVNKYFIIKEPLTLLNFRPVVVTFTTEVFLTTLHEIEIPNGKYSTVTNYLTHYCIFSRNARVFTQVT